MEERDTTRFRLFMLFGSAIMFDASVDGGSFYTFDVLIAFFGETE